MSVRNRRRGSRKVIRNNNSGRKSPPKKQYVTNARDMSRFTRAKKMVNNTNNLNNILPINPQPMMAGCVQPGGGYGSWPGDPNMGLDADLCPPGYLPVQDMQLAHPNMHSSGEYIDSYTMYTQCVCQAMTGGQGTGPGGGGGDDDDTAGGIGKGGR